MADNVETITAKLAERRAKKRPAPADPNLPVVKVRAGELPRMTDEAEAALIEAEAGLYRHGGRVVRVVRDSVPTSRGPLLMLRLMQVHLAHMLESFMKAASFEKYDGRVGGDVPADCPKLLAEMYLARGEWRLPALLGVITAPTLRPDGTILDQPGYDAATCLLFDPQGATFPPIPAEPTKDQAVDALKALKEPIRLFSFVTDADRAVALSCILTAVARRALPVTPLHAFTAPVAGSGKSMLVDIAAAIATGKPAATTSTGRDKFGDAELEKRLTSSMLAGDAIVTIDNLENPLGGELLCQLLTQRTVKLRPLGKSINVEVPNTTTFCATGNNLTIVGDATRRCLVGTLDPRCERPELREFDFEPFEVVEAERGKFVVAALTILRAYHAAGRPEQETPLGSYREWSRAVRDALLWLGEADPVGTLDKSRASDPRLARLTAMMEAWQTEWPGESKLVRDVIARAMLADDDGKHLLHPALYEAVAAVAQSHGKLSADRLGWWLRKNEGRVVDDRRFVRDGDEHNAVLWKLETLSKPPGLLNASF